MNESISNVRYLGIQVVRQKTLAFPHSFSLALTKDTTQVPKEFLVLGGGLVFCTFLFLGIGAGSLCSIVGFIYPAYKSFEAIESKNRGEDTQWLIYWVVYAFFSILEVFIDFLVYWIPFYYAFKLAFLLWAMLPQTKGAKFLYDSFLKDFLKQNESKIDAALADAKKNASHVATEASTVVGAAMTAATAALSDENKKEK
jgi:receptor expression-enhancing protein 5/6